MVAVRGASWVLAPSLVMLFEQINRAYPGRDRQSDGSIGDLAHRQRKSDHNPDAEGIVRALDIDEDVTKTGSREPARGIVEAIRASRDNRLKYLIYEGQLFSSYSNSQRKAWEWGPYTGANPHDRHFHLSILPTETAAMDTRPWQIFDQGDEMLTRDTTAEPLPELEPFHRQMVDARVMTEATQPNGVAFNDEVANFLVRYTQRVLIPTVRDEIRKALADVAGPSVDDVIAAIAKRLGG